MYLHHTEQYNSTKQSAATNLVPTPQVSFAISIANIKMGYFRQPIIILPLICWLQDQNFEPRNSGLVLPKLQIFNMH
jgi:hypothetical protein